MPIREILLLGNPTLRVKCEKVRNFSDRKLKQTIEDLRDTLEEFRRTHGFGRGIAAPQIGVTRRIVFIDVTSPMAMINPEIVKKSAQKMTMWDDCFSFPAMLVKVNRHAKITVRYHDENGVKQQVEADGGLAELLQHEMDHLNGILAIDRAIDSKHIIMRSVWEKMKLTHKDHVSL